MIIAGHSIQIHSKVNKSFGNGPGSRAVLWVQGCPFDCRGCSNPKLKEFNHGSTVPVESLVEWVMSLKGIEGISISGGEPTAQLLGLNPFLSTVRKETGLSVLVFSGRTENEILKLAGGRQLMEMIDVLIEGPYNRALCNPPGVWPSSKNQKINFLTNKYDQKDFLGLPETEMIITDQGEVVQTGLGGISVL